MNMYSRCLPASKTTPHTERQLFKKVTLDNGIRFVGEQIEALDVVSIGFWFNVGSADEPKELNGYTHIIEHMLFKGTEKYSSLDIVKAIEGVGGIFNAFTSRHFTAFYISILSSHVDTALDILREILESSRFEEEELAREKRVVMEEIRLSNDSPEEIVSQQFFSNFFKGSAMAYPIAGTLTNVKNVKRKGLVDYFKKMFTASNLVVSVAGKFDFNAVAKKIVRIDIPRGKPKKAIPEITPSFRIRNAVKENLHQVYFCLVHRSYAAGNPKNYALIVLNNILGNGSSSRLFQTLREQYGLCYSVFSYNSSFHPTGTFEIHASTSFPSYGNALRLVFEEIDRLRAYEISEEEIHNAKEMYKGTIAFNKMNADFIMNKNAKHEFYYKRHFTFEDMYDLITSVDKEQIHKVIDEVFDRRKYFLSVVGPRTAKEVTSYIVKEYARMPSNK